MHAVAVELDFAQPFPPVACHLDKLGQFRDPLRQTALPARVPQRQGPAPISANCSCSMFQRWLPSCLANQPDFSSGEGSFGEKT